MSTPEPPLPPREALAEARVRAPTRGNWRLERLLESVNQDQRVKAWWHVSAVNATRRLGMSDHSWVCKFASNYSSGIGIQRSPVCRESSSAIVAVARANASADGPSFLGVACTPPFWLVRFCPDPGRDDGRGPEEKPVGVIGPPARRSSVSSDRPRLAVLGSRRSTSVDVGATDPHFRSRGLLERFLPYHP